MTDKSKERLPYAKKRWEGAGNLPTIHAYNWSVAVSVSDEGFLVVYDTGDFGGSHFIDREFPALLTLTECDEYAAAIATLIDGFQDNEMDPFALQFIEDRVFQALLEDDIILNAPACDA